MLSHSVMSDSVAAWIVAHQARLSTEFPRQECWSGLLFPSLYVSISSVQFSRSVVSDSATPWTAARQVSLSINNTQSLLKLMPIESMMPSNHLILCRPRLHWVLTVLLEWCFSTLDALSNSFKKKTLPYQPEFLA